MVKLDAAHARPGILPRRLPLCVTVVLAAGLLAGCGGGDGTQNAADTSPPGPFRCGSTTWRTKPVATAASNALPPRSSTAMPVAEASQ